VDIRRPAANGIQHDLVDEAHDRRVFDVVAADLLVIILVPGDLQGLEIDVGLVRERRHLVVHLLERFINRPLELVVLGYDRLDAEARPESHLIDRMEVGRVSHRQKQSLSTPEQRQHTVLGDELVADQADYIEVEVHGVDVK